VENILLSKLRFYGIGGKFHDLITSYLSDIYQRVLIASDFSRLRKSKFLLNQLLRDSKTVWLFTL
jgi:hypothetical protein